MKFGRVENPENVDFTLPEDHPRTLEILRAAAGKPLEAYVGCAKWNRGDLKGFYPRGVKDELVYYGSQFNAIELNATYYRMPRLEQVKSWKEKVGEEFRFFPKVPRFMSHLSRLSEFQRQIADYTEAIRGFEKNLGMSFLQLPGTFKPGKLDRLEHFLFEFPASVPLGVEARHEAWFADSQGEAFFQLLEQEGRAAVIVDTAGRRDMLHMRLTTPHAFIRYVGANIQSDYSRLDGWVERIARWYKEGLQALYFFVHQNKEEESPKLAAYFTKKLNKRMNLSIPVPETL